MLVVPVAAAERGSVSSELTGTLALCMKYKGKYTSNSAKRCLAHFTRRHGMLQCIPGRVRSAAVPRLMARLPQSMYSYMPILFPPAVAPAHRQFLRHRSSLFPSSHTSLLHTLRPNTDCGPLHVCGLLPVSWVAGSLFFISSSILSSSACTLLALCNTRRSIANPQLSNRLPSTLASSLARFFFPRYPSA